jgi:DNA-binding transcriptional ArsR family regulator
MAPPDDLMLMTRFVKLLGDRGRLAIVGLLAARPRSREELARELPGASPATLARNLKLLGDAEWIDSDEEDRYRLRPEALTTLRAALARVEVAPHLATSRAEIVPAHKKGIEPPNALVNAFFDDHGRLRRLPEQKRQRERVLRALAEENFTLGRSYEEREVDETLEPLFDDVDRLRLALVSDGVLVNRDGRYWLSVPR